MSPPPRTFAAEGDTATTDYVFNYTVFGLSAGLTITNLTADNFKQFDTTKSSGVWNAVYRRSNVTYALLEKGIQVIANKNDGTNLTSANLGANGLAIRITVPEKGEFVPTVNFAKYYTAGLCRVMLISVDDAVNKLAMSEALTASNIANILIGAANTDKYAIELEKNGEKGFDGFDAEANSKDVFAVTDSKSFDKIALEKGDYFLVFGIDRLNSKRYAVDEQNGAVALTTMAGYSYLLKSFSLRKLGEVVATADKNEYEIGETINISASVADAFGQPVEATVSFESQTPNVAKVEADGKIVAVGAGTATIKATAIVDGFEVSGNVDVKVLTEDMGNNGVKLEYIFKTSALTDETIARAQAENAWDSRGILTNLAIVNDYSSLNQTTAPWAYGNLVGYSHHIQNNLLMTMEKVRYGHQTLDPYVALKLKISNKGWYMLSADVNKADFGTAANVYIFPADNIENIDRTHIAGKKAIGTFDVSFGSSDVGAVYIPKRGDYYVVMDFNTQNPTTYQGKGKHYLYLNKLALTAIDGPAADDINDMVSFVATANVDVDITVDGFDYNGKVDTVRIGEKIKVTAPEKVGNYEFKYWKTGFDNSKNYVSNSNVYEFTAITNIFLTAVYDEIDTVSADKVKVEFYNGNKQFIKEAFVSKTDAFSTIKPANPSIIGYGFAGWESEAGSLNDDSTFNKDTRVVAQYEEIGNAISGDVVANYATIDEKNYGAEVVLEDASAKYWMRDGKIIAYGTKYTHYIWGATKITFSIADVEKEPVIILEDTAVDGAYMIEYDAADEKLHEVGIVFGNNKSITAGGCTSKATSQRKDKHGQFAAKPNSDETFARGYLIYNDGGRYKVIYTNAIEIK